MPSENSTYKFWHLNIIEGCEWPVPEEWEPKAHWMLSRIADYQETADRERRLTELIEKCCRELEKGDDQAILSAMDEIRTIPGADEKPEYEQLCRRIAGILPISGARSIRTVSMKNEEFKNQLIKEANDKCYILESSAGLLKKKYQIVSKEPGDAAKDTYYRVTMMTQTTQPAFMWTMNSKPEKMNKNRGKTDLSEPLFQCGGMILYL